MKQAVALSKFGFCAKFGFFAVGGGMQSHCLWILNSIFCAILLPLVVNYLIDLPKNWPLDDIVNYNIAVLPAIIRDPDLVHSWSLLPLVMWSASYTPTRFCTLSLSRSRLEGSIISIEIVCFQIKVGDINIVTQNSTGFGCTVERLVSTDVRILFKLRSCSKRKDKTILDMILQTRNFFSKFAENSLLDAKVTCLIVARYLSSYVTSHVLPMELNSKI